MLMSFVEHLVKGNDDVILDVKEFHWMIRSMWRLGKAGE